MELTKKNIGSSEERNYNELKLTSQLLTWINSNKEQPDEEIRTEMQSLLSKHFGITQRSIGKSQKIIPFCSNVKRDIPIVSLANDLKKNALKTSVNRASLIESWFLKWNNSIFVLELNQTKTLFKITKDMFYVIIGVSPSKLISEYKIQIAVAFSNPLHAMIFYYKFCFTQNVNYFASIVDEKLVTEAKVENIQLEKIIDGDSYLLYDDDLNCPDHEVHINYVLSKKMVSLDSPKRSVKTMISSLFDILNDGIVTQEQKKIKRNYDEVVVIQSKSSNERPKKMKMDVESKEIDQEKLLFGNGVISMGNLTQKTIVPQNDKSGIYLPKNTLIDAETKDSDVKIVNSEDMNRMQKLIDFSYNKEKKITDDMKCDIGILNCLKSNNISDPVSFINNIEKNGDDIRQHLIESISSRQKLDITHEPFLGNDMHYTSLMKNFLTASIDLRDYLNDNPQIEEEKRKIESQLEERQKIQSQISIPIQDIETMINLNSNGAKFAEIHTNLMKSEKNAFQCVLLRFIIMKYFDSIKEKEYIDNANFCDDLSTKSTYTVLIEEFNTYLKNYNKQILLTHILKLKEKGCQYVCSTIASELKLVGNVDQSRLSEVSLKSFDTKDVEFVVDEMISTFNGMCKHHIKSDRMGIEEVKDMFLTTNAKLKRRIIDEISKIKNRTVLTEIYEFMMNFHPVMLLFTQKIDPVVFDDKTNEDSPLKENFKWSYKNVTPKDFFDVAISLDRISSINQFYSTVSKNDEEMMLFMKPTQIVFKKSETVLRYDVSKWTNVTQYFAYENLCDGKNRNISDAFKKMNIQQIVQYFVDINLIQSIIVSNINAFKIHQQQQKDVTNAFELLKYFTLFDHNELEDFIPIAIPNFDKQKINEKVSEYKTRWSYFHILTDIVVNRISNYNVDQINSLYIAFEEITKKNLLIDCIVFSVKEDKFLINTIKK